MTWSNRILVLLTVASALAGTPGGTCMAQVAAADMRAGPEVWPDGGPSAARRVRIAVAGFLGCPPDDFMVPRAHDEPILVTPRLGPYSTDSALGDSDILWSPARAAFARRAGGKLLSGFLGFPAEQFAVPQTYGDPLADSGGWAPGNAPSEFIDGESAYSLGIVEAARNGTRDLMAEILGYPTDRSAPTGDATFVSNRNALAEEPLSGMATDAAAPNGDAQWEPFAEPWYNTPVAPPYGNQTAVRFGWWSVLTNGDLTTLGEFQDLHPSRFVDVDQLSSDGLRTWDLFVTGMDNKATQAGLYFYGPRVSADVEYQHYLRRLIHDPLSNFSAPGSGDVLVAEDTNAGEDYAIRVEELETDIHGKLTKNIKYRVNFWLQRKNGDRQAIGSQHCTGGNMFGNNSNATCHVLSQTQQIDWLTLRVEPIVEGKWGPVTVEYSRPMRSFGQNDQIVTRQYGDFSLYGFSGQHPYAFVPENFKQTDRVKMGVRLTERTRLYSKMLTSNVHNQFRATDRRVYDVDLRLTNQPTNRLTLTGYGWMNLQKNQFPPFFVDPEGQALSPTYVSMFGGTIEPQLSAIVPRYGLRHPIDYSRYTFGAEATWKPELWTELAKGLSFSAGCETGVTHRDYADYFIEQTAAVFNQRRTSYLSYFATAKMGWSPKFKTFLRYKGRNTNDPLYGVDQIAGVTNTSLPEQEHLVEIGGTWVPAPSFIANINAGIQNRLHSSSAVDFEEDSYPLTVTVYYAPTYNLTLNAGYGSYSNWIDQDIWFPGDNPAVDRWDRRTWSYGGRSRILSLGAGYAYTPRVTLTGGIEFVWARDAIDPFQPWPDLPEYFDVVVNKTRLNAGIDFWLRDGISAYFRYLFDEYEDKSVGYNSGTAHLFLAGATAVF